MQAVTAQKLVLIMISTTTIIPFGEIKGDKMVDMRQSNNKLVDRGIKTIMSELNIDFGKAKALLETHRNVKSAIQNHIHGN